ncbi:MULTISPECIES: hypothetical protein [Peribacillus]|uniref:hypothetical protein n=1 Tax=Peribacillus TaxID=2675229 RepID=UPI0019144E36|nr:MULTISPECIES: hypothetical protein [unclassified Peribacillus]MBK5441517.1 hypothetical protein [Peribacillus sp. TH24]MBK5458551.1 hypothetical protein [Peribacillus sp. TH27]MBK5480453.1 hypothetical protein [Peribacillus sp. TH16]MBK5501963.1 hypothetical protein [Peribacillus sp. TH14]WMX58053.1 hypothetical protein RE409_13010 [Peribacillus sp. R9-11]
MDTKERQALELLLSPELINKLESLSAKTDMSIPELLEISVASLIEKMSNTTELNVGLNNKEMILRNKIIINQNKDVLNI